MNVTRGTMKIFWIYLAVASLLAGFSCAADKSPLTGETVPLWEGKAPLARGTDAEDTPTLTRYFPDPDKASGTAVVICPGGGYGHLALGHEGEAVAQWLLDEGIAAFVLQYRHAPRYRHPAPLTDAQRALRTVRAHAEEWGIRPDCIGILGFSAGGHLTATAGTQFEPGDATASDPIERVSSRPDFLVLVYPVITLESPYTHMGSRNNLLGRLAKKDEITFMSAENRVTKDTPPAFLVHGDEDTAVPAENTILFYSALRKKGVQGSEIHLYKKGPHGFGLGTDDPVLSTWPTHCIAWLRGLGKLK